MRDAAFPDGETPEKDKDGIARPGSKKLELQQLAACELEEFNKATEVSNLFNTVAANQQRCLKRYTQRAQTLEDRAAKSANEGLRREAVYARRYDCARELGAWPR